MTVHEIIKKYLEENGYDGLCSFDCGCTVEDLAPCGGDFSACVPGYKVPCPGPEECENGGDCKFHIAAKKAGD